MFKKRLLENVRRLVAPGAFALGLLSLQASAQTLSDYSFASDSTGTYSSISGGLLLGTTSNDDEVYLDPLAPGGVQTTNPTGPGLDIGFSFNYNGAAYDRVGISTNGWIALGQSTLTPSIDMNNSGGIDYFYPVISTGFGFQAAVLQNRIAILNTDLQEQAGSSIRIQTLGTAPNRVCVIQWEGFRKYTSSTTSSDNFNFQIRLYETTDLIEFSYGSFASDALDGLPQVGLVYGSSFLDRKTTTSWRLSSEGTANTDQMRLDDVVAPTSGLRYSWVVPPKTYSSSTVSSSSTLSLSPGNLDQQIVRLSVIVDGARSTLDATSLTVGTAGTTSVSDISSIKVYYTGSSSTFSTATLFGSTTSPATTNVIGGSVNLNKGNNYFWVTYDVASGAVLGNVLDASVTSVTVGGVARTPSVTSPAGSRLIANPMTFVSANTTQANTAKLNQSTNNNQIIGIEVVTSATGSAINLSSFDIATTGTTSLSDISNLKVWYTGTSSTFATTTQFGSTVATPLATQTVTGTQPLSNGTNYFWVTYDISSGAVTGNQVDAECTSITVDGNTQVPTTTAPTGTREIKPPYCLPTYSNGCNTDYIARVRLKNLDNASNTCNGNATFFNNVTVPTIAMGEVDTLIMNYGSDGNQYGRAWIDLNDDGDFNDPGEDLGAQTPANAGSNGQAQIIFRMPCGANVGQLRLRIRGGDDNQPSASMACGASNSAWGESEDYLINVVATPVTFTYNTAIQQTGTVAAGTPDKAILRIPVVSKGCGAAVGTVFSFNTAGSTAASDIASAKLYATGNSTTFNVTKLVGTVSAPNGAFSFTVNDTLLNNDTTNYWLAYDFSPSATTGNVADARLDSIQLNGSYYVPATGNPAGNIQILTPMTYNSSSVLQLNTTKVAQGSTNNVIGILRVVTSSTGAPLNVTSIDVSTNGSSALSDIGAIKVWYTGNSRTFAATTQFGSTAASPAATQTITGVQAVGNDTSYFWVTYDIPGGATLGDSVDAEITSFTIGGSTTTPTVTAPAGNRKIRMEYCTPQYFYAADACNYAYYINSVTTTGAVVNINNTNSGCPGTSQNYVLYSNNPISARQNEPFTINIQDLYGYDGYAVWIDYDQSGDFSGSELAFQSAYMQSATGTITIPCSAVTGTTRMRIRSYDFGTPYDPCVDLYYGETEDYPITIIANPIAYTSSGSIQVTGAVFAGATDKPVLRIPVKTQGCGTATATIFNFSTAGSTAASDIAAAKLYRTNTSASFNTSTLVASVASPSGSFSFTVNDTLVTNDTTNYWLAYDISGGATIGNTLDATFDSLQVLGAYKVPSVSNPAGNLTIDVPLSYLRSSVSQNVTSKVGTGTANNQIARVRVIMSSTGAPVSLTSMDVSTNGTSALSDISNLTIWYTGHSNVFATGTQFGTTIASPAATQTITGSLLLTNDTNYLWVTYDIPGAAVIGDSVDAEVTSLTINGTQQTPLVTAPTGNRKIRSEYCTAGLHNSFSPCITNVTLGSLNSTTPSGSCSLPSYALYSATGTVLKGNTYSLSVITDGSTILSVWIDYNNDGILASNEWNQISTSNTANTPTVIAITIPCDAVTGTTRMRVRARATLNNNFAGDACTSFGSGETEDYDITIGDNPVAYAYSNAIQQTGTIAPGTSDRQVLRVPVVGQGCGVPLATTFNFSTAGSTAASDILAAKLYVTGNSAAFNTSKLLATVSSPSGAFSFSVMDTLLTSDTTNYWLAYDINPAATIGDVVDARFDSVEAVGAYHVPATSNPAGNLLIDAPMTFVSSTVTQSNTSQIARGTANNPIIALQVVMSATGSPVAASSIDVSTNGTTSLTDVSNLKIWYTGSSSTFVATTQFGSTVNAPGATATVTGSQALTNGANYFWVTYDLDPGATLGNFVDAELTSVTVGGSAQTPSVTAPAGNRKIRADYCTNNLYVNACSSDDYVNNVSTTGATTNLSNLNSGCNGNANNFIYYSGQTLTVSQGSIFTLNYQAGISYSQGFKVYIDYNQDGVYDATELVASAAPATTLNTATIVVPLTATVGNTRIRVRCAYNTIPVDACSNESYGEVEDYNVVINPAPPTTIYTWNQTSPASFGTAANWTPNRTEVNLVDALRFNSGTAVTVNTVTTQRISRLIVNNNTTVTLAGGANITLTAADSLVLNGKIVAGPTITLALGADSVNIGSLSGNGTIEGKFARWINGTTTHYDFPLAVGNDSRAVSFDYTAAPSVSGMLTAQFSPTNPGVNGLPLNESGINVNRASLSGFWALNPSSGLSGGLYTTTLAAQNFGAVFNYTGLVMLQRSGTSAAWTLQGTHVTTTGSNAQPVLNRTGMSNYGQFGVGGDTNVNPLPVSLLSFGASRAKEDVLLDWSTSSELNNAGFSIERSIDGRSFEAVGFVEGHGTASNKNTYAFRDGDAFSKANAKVLYYRLRQQDFDGAFTYSNVVRVLDQKSAASAIAVMPNPFASDLQASINLKADQSFTLTLTDIQGREVATRTVYGVKGSNRIGLEEYNTLQGGVYFLKAEIDGELTITRIVKIK